MRNKKSILTTFRLLLISAVLITAFTGCVSANREQGRRRGGGESREKPVFSDMDVNNDGYVNKDEFKGPLNLFTEIDENGDSLITEEEFSNMPEPPAGRPPKRS